MGILGIGSGVSRQAKPLKTPPHKFTLMVLELLNLLYCDFRHSTLVSNVPASVSASNDADIIVLYG